tara:strand:+ start:1363 stop:1566 length:204 start_codon:yes stop_codon:yes gene_type:complete
MNESDIYQYDKNRGKYAYISERTNFGGVIESITIDEAKKKVFYNILLDGYGITYPFDAKKITIKETY